VGNDVFMNWRGRTSPPPATPARVERAISADLNRFWVTASREQHKAQSGAANASPTGEQRSARAEAAQAEET